VNIVVRKAETTDVDWLLPQLLRFSDFYGTKHSLFGDVDYARAALARMIENHLFIIAESKDVGPIGFIAGSLVLHPYNPKIKVLAENFWWVDEAHRGTRAGAILLKVFMEYGKENADWINFTLEQHSPVNEKTLLKRGFRLQERTYLMEVV
jgi:RimJ/RimL family protein N-acetyltransferase